MTAQCGDLQDFCRGTTDWPDGVECIHADLLNKVFELESYSSPNVPRSFALRGGAVELQSNTLSRMCRRGVDDSRSSVSVLPTYFRRRVNMVSDTEHFSNCCHVLQSVVKVWH